MSMYCNECGVAISSGIVYYTQDGRALCQEHRPAESVALISSGYDWFCPKCDAENHETEAIQEVQCTECKTWLDVEDHLHAWRQE